jgi:hypothetical protein
MKWVRNFDNFQVVMSAIKNFQADNHYHATNAEMCAVQEFVCEEAIFFKIFFIFFNFFLHNFSFREISLRSVRQSVYRNLASEIVSHPPWWALSAPPAASDLP